MQRVVVGDALARVHVVGPYLVELPTKSNHRPVGRMVILIAARTARSVSDRERELGKGIAVADGLGGHEGRGGVAKLGISRRVEEGVRARGPKPCAAVDQVVSVGDVQNRIQRLPRREEHCGRRVLRLRLVRHEHELAVRLDVVPDVVVREKPRVVSLVLALEIVVRAIVK